MNVDNNIEQYIIDLIVFNNCEDIFTKNGSKKAVKIRIILEISNNKSYTY